MTSKPAKIRILVVDDHFFVRLGLSGALNREPDLRVVAEAANGAQALALYREHHPDVVVLDFRLPDMDGVAVTQALLKEFPAARVVMLTEREGEEDIFRAVQAGVCGYLQKSGEREPLLVAIRRVHAGEKYFPPEVAARLSMRLGRAELSAREMDVLRCVVAGMSNKEIGNHLNISELTVKRHVGQLLEKLGVQYRTQAATAAIRRGLVDLP